MGRQSLRSTDFDVTVVIRPSKLAYFVTKAMTSKSGRCELGGGAVVVLTKQVARTMPTHDAERRAE